MKKRRYYNIIENTKTYNNSLEELQEIFVKEQKIKGYHCISSKYKYVDYEYQFETVLVPAIITINATKQGADYYERIGSKITMKRLFLRYWWETTGTPTTNNSWKDTKLAIIYDRVPRPNNQEYIDYYQTTNLQGIEDTTNRGTDFPNLTAQNEVIWIKDYWFQMQDMSNGYTTNGCFTTQNQLIKTTDTWDIDLHNLPTTYLQDEIENIQPTTGALKVIINPNGNSVNYLLKFNARIIFEDCD